MKIENKSKTINCEILIVGSGAGGSAVAETLVKEGHDVLMIEEGPYANQNKKIESSIESFTTQWRSGGLNAAIGKPIISYAEGRCVGGGTEINSAIIQRPPEELITKWQKDYCIDNFNVNEINNYLDKVLTRLNASYTIPPLGKPSEILKIAGEKLNWKTQELMRAQKGNSEINPFSSGEKNNGKQSMSVSLISESIDKGMRLIPNCKLVKINTKNRKAINVKALINNGRSKEFLNIKAKHYFLSCGAIYTPLLLRSNKLSKNAGNTLQIHPTIKVIAKFKQEIDAHKSHVPLYAITQFMPNIRIGGSNFTPGIFGMSLAEDWENRKDFIAEYNKYGIYYAMVRGTGIGKVRSTPLFNEPLVSYKLSKRNWEDISKGLVYLSEAMFTAGATDVIPSIDSHLGWNRISQTKKEINNFGLPKSKSFLSSVHLFGSCPIGENKKLSCVANSFGKLNDFENIFIADASIIPESLGVNPQATVMALSYRVADYFLESN